MLLHHFLEHSASQYPDNVAVIYDQARITYKQLNMQADYMACNLKSSGIKKGDRAAILLENSLDYIIAYYAVLKIGAIAAPLNPGLKPDGLKYALEDLEPTVLISNFRSERLLRATELNPSFLKLIVIKNPKQKWDHIPIKVVTFDECVTACDSVLTSSTFDENDLANIIYTSGSTGAPKGVMLSHKNIVSNTNAICGYLKLSENDIQMVVLPFFYVMGKSLLNTHVAVGGTLVINNRFLYPADVVNQMIEERVTGFSGVPSTYAYLLNRSPLTNRRDELNALRYVSQAGGHMALALKKALRKTLPDHTQIYVMYGATEASARLTYLEPDAFNLKSQSIGKPLKNVSIRILDEKGHDVPDGSEGELVASGPNIMQGYWKAPDETKNVLNADGYHTGDIGYRDPDGFLFVKNRKDGLIKVGGHRINPTEIEDLLQSTQMVLESAVVGINDQLLGKKLVALVVANHDDCNADFIMKKCAEGLPKHKWPSDIHFIRVLPKNANGKVDRHKCIEIVQKC